MSQAPESDLARNRGFCKTRVPAELVEQVRIDSRVRGATVTIVECRPPLAEIEADPTRILWG